LLFNIVDTLSVKLFFLNIRFWKYHDVETRVSGHPVTP